MSCLPESTERWPTKAPTVRCESGRKTCSRRMLRPNNFAGKGKVRTGLISHLLPAILNSSTCNPTTMSHSHTHAPGEVHSHSHGTPQTPISAVIPTPDPILQALIDQDFVPVPLTLSSDNSSALCASHKLEKCDDCKVDFVNTNRLAKLLLANPNLLCPPPSNVISQKLTQAVQATKDEGNVRPFIYVFNYRFLNIRYRPYLNAVMLPKP